MTSVRAGRHQGELPRARATDPRVLGRGRRVRAVARSPREDAPDVGLLRGPADGERQTGHPPRRAAHLQGRLPALQDDDRVTSCAAKGGWDCHGLPVELEVEKEIGTTGQARHRGVRRRGVQRALPRVGPALRRRVRAADRADRLLDRHVRRLLDDGRRLHRVGVVVAEAAARARPAGRGPTRSPRTARAAARRCPTPRWRSATEHVEDPSVFLRFPIVEAADAGPWSAPRSRCGRRRRGRCRPTPARPSPPTPTTSWSRADGRAD